MQNDKRTIVLKVTPEDYETFKAAAKASSLTLSGWLRFVAKRAAKREK